MVTPVAKREAVAHLRDAHQMSERRACRVIGCPRMTVRYRSRRPDDRRLRERLAALARERRRFGYRRLLVFLRREGFVVNHKRLFPHNTTQRRLVDGAVDEHPDTVAKLDLDGPSSSQRRLALPSNPHRQQVHFPACRLPRLTSPIAQQVRVHVVPMGHRRYHRTRLKALPNYFRLLRRRPATPPLRTRQHRNRRH